MSRWGSTEQGWKSQITVFYTVLGLACASWGLSTPTLAARRVAKAHEHGRGKLNLVVDAKNVQIEMELPLADLIGFEHQARNASEEALLRQVLSPSSHLEDLKLSAAAQCQQNGLVIETRQQAVHEHRHEHQATHDGHGHHKKPSGKHQAQHQHLHRHSAAEPAGQHSSHEHADISLRFTFVCQHPELLHSVAVPLLQQKPGLSLQGRFVTPQKQGLQLLTAAAAELHVR